MQNALSFVQECRAFPEHEYGVILGTGLQRSISVDEYPPEFNFFPVDRRPAGRPGRALLGNIFSRIEREFSPDGVFTTSGPSYWRPRAPHLVGYNLPHHIYPDSPFFGSNRQNNRNRQINPT